MNYGTLEVEVRKHFFATNKPKSEHKKLPLILKSFMTALSRSESDLVEIDLVVSKSSESEKIFKDFLLNKKNKKNESLSSATIESYVSFAKNNFSKLYQTSLSVLAIIGNNNFGNSLKALRERKNWTRQDLVSKLEKEYSISVHQQMIIKFESSEAFPRQKETVSAIEILLNAPAGALLSKVPYLELGDCSISPKKKFSEALKRHFNFGFKTDPNKKTPFELDVDKLLEFKSADSGDLTERDLRRGRRSAHNSVQTTFGTREIYLRYAGYLTLPIDGVHPLCSGRGYDINKIRLPDLLSSENIKSYLQFCKLRQEHAGQPTGTPHWFLTIFKCLRDISSSEGYLVQHREDFLDYDGIFSKAAKEEESWKHRLGKQYESLGQHQSKLHDDGTEKGNDKIVYLEKILSMDRPIKALVDVVKNMGHDIDIYSKLGGSFAEEVHYLRLYRAFFAIESCYPLRITQLNEKALITDLTKSLEDKGQYILKIRKKDFKNKRSPATFDGELLLKFDETNDLKMDVAAVIDDYLENSRHYFVGQSWKMVKIFQNQASRLLASGKTGDAKRAKGLLSKAESVTLRLFPIILLKRRHSQYTKIYSGENIAWNFHSNRHIVATDKTKHFFRLGHNGFMFAAAALFDTEKTVRVTYSKFGPKDVNALAHDIHKATLNGGKNTSKTDATNPPNSNAVNIAEWVTDYVNREKNILLAASSDELETLFPDPKVRKMIKARLSALMRLRE